MNLRLAWVVGWAAIVVCTAGWAYVAWYPVAFAWYVPVYWAGFAAAV